MPLRIAFDLDGVLADMEGGLLRQAEVLFGKATLGPDQESAMPSEPPSAEAPPPGESPAAPPRTPDALEQAPTVNFQMTARQERRLWRHIETIENFWESLTEIEPGSVARLGDVAAERRWEILFLTKRPQTAGSTAQLQTQRWLQAKGFTLPSVYVVQGSRGRIAAALGLDIVVDDRPENCLDVVVDSRARAILVWRADEKQLPAAARRLGIGVVHSIDQCIDVLKQVDTPGSERAGLMGRVKRLLGLNEPAEV